MRRFPIALRNGHGNQTLDILIKLTGSDDFTNQAIPSHFHLSFNHILLFTCLEGSILFLAGLLTNPDVLIWNVLSIISTEVSTVSGTEVGLCLGCVFVEGIVRDYQYSFTIWFSSRFPFDLLFKMVMDGKNGWSGFKCNNKNFVFIYAF